MVPLSEEEKFFGMRFSPLKMKVLKILKEIFKLELLKDTLPEDKINADLFSAHQLRLISHSDETLVMRTDFFTSLKIFEKYTAIFYDKLSVLNIYSKQVLETFNNYQIKTDKSFLNFIAFLIENFAVNNINTKSGYKYFWSDRACKKEPKSEPEAQPYLLSTIESLCELKGVSAVREPSSAEGKIDMFFSFTTPQHKLLKVCLEIKNAHHDHVVNGVKTQLKAYMDSQHTTNGIYLVLWYKNKTDFSKPANFQTKEALQAAIELEIPTGYNIKVILIDCNKPIYPSQLRA